MFQEYQRKIEPIAQRKITFDMQYRKKNMLRDWMNIADFMIWMNYCYSQLLSCIYPNGSPWSHTISFCLWKIYKCLFLPNCTRKIMWLLINNINEKISRWLSRRNARVSRNQGKIAPSIAPSKACAWFENKRFDWPSVSFSDHWPIRMFGLFPLFALN